MASVLPNHRATQAPSPWLRRFSPTGDAPIKLLCFPYAGAGANVYRAWATLLDKRIELLAVQLPGREARLREPCAHSAQEITDAVVSELMRTCPLQPLALFGHSMGTVLAYDLARRLQDAHGWPLRALFVSGRLPPHLVHGGDFHRRPEPEFIAEIRRLNGTPDAIFDDEEMRHLVLPVLRADYRVIETYGRPAPGALRCPIVSCTSDGDDDAPRALMDEWQALGRGPHEGWDFEGDHFYVKDRAAALTQRLNHYLLGHR
jgi:surfactin synthase thioesterase subunit